MKKQILISTLALILFPLQFRGDDQVRSVQEELRRRNLYFGDIDGRRSDEFSEAVRRYQKRKGFAASGTEDRDTLRSMGLVARLPGEPVPKELEWPEEPVLRSDTPIAAPAAEEAMSQETGLPTEIFDTKHMLKAPSEKEISLASAHTKRVSTHTPLPSIAARNDPRLAPANLLLFAKNYVRSLSSKELQEQLHFYGDRVKYFHSGTIDRRLIEHSLRDYALRWPSRHYTIGEVIDYAPLRSRGEIVLTFRVHFKLRGHGKKVEGITEDRVVINAATSDPRIISIDERRVKK
ncbi:MAG: peptidoglycan-binding domain-containing protein [Chthoniobacteraceae bacterium]